MSRATLSATPYSGIFRPTSIAGCQLWLDGADATQVTYSTGSNISQWKDKSGNANHGSQSIAGQQPYYSTTSNAVVFSGAQVMTCPLSASSTIETCFFVFSTTINRGVLIGAVTAPGRNIDFYQSYNMRIVQQYNALVLSSSYTFSPNTTVLVATQTTSTNSYIFMYGTQTDSNSTVANYGSGIASVIGTNGSDPPVEPFNGPIFEMIIFNTVLTTPQRQQVEGYLAWKWGIQANLPGGHLHVSAAPTAPNALGITRPAISIALAPTGVRSLGNAPYKTTFRPTSVPGCQLWLDAADATTFTITSGSNVSTWSDKSGSNSSLSNTTSNPPYFTTYNGYPTVSFRGSLSSTSNVLSNQTFSVAPANISIFIVTQALQNGSTFIYPGILTIFPNPLSGYDYRNGLSISGGNATTQILSVYGGGTGNTITGIDYSGSGLTPRGVYSVVNTTNILYAYANGTQWGTNTFTFDATNVGIALGMRHLGSLRAEGGASAYDGNISEVIVYNTALTTTQRQQIEGYLAWKWGLQASLPQALAPPFTNPTTIPGCILWLDATDPAGTGVQPANGTTLTTWKDKSVSNFPFTSVGSAYNTTAVNGLPGMTLSTNFIGYDPGSAQNNWQEVFAVGLWTGGSTFNSYNGLVTSSVDSDGGVGGGILFIGNAGSTNWWGPGNTYVQQIINGTQTGSAFPAIQTPFIARTFSATAVNLRGLRFGIDRSFTDRKWVGFISEVICYNTALTATQRLQVEGYLAWKWGSQANLVNTHTYYSASPAHSHSAAAPTGASLRPALSAALVPAGVRGLAAKAKISIFTQTFSYTGADQTYVIPAGVTSITLYMWAAGGQGTTTSNGSFYGGAGAYIQGNLTVTPGETLTIYVGQKGPVGFGSAYKNGGFNDTTDQGCGGGGGRSGIARGSTNIIAVGAGGGGGGSGNGGAGGITEGNAGGGTNPGGGGTQTSGGGAGYSEYNNGGGGDNFSGGHGPGAYGGSGGDGYYGGGGGAAYGADQLGGGGGGGSSLTSALTSLVTFVSSNGYSAPNTSSQYYVSGVAAGGYGLSGSGGNGLVIITYSA